MRLDPRFRSNVYFDPEKTGFALVAQMNDPTMDYSFKTLIVLRHQDTGDLYWVEDEGCSCPTPFEHVKSLSDLRRIDPMALNVFFSSASAWAFESNVTNDDYRRFEHTVHRAIEDAPEPGTKHQRLLWEG